MRQDLAEHVLHGGDVPPPIVAEHDDGRARLPGHAPVLSKMMRNLLARIDSGSQPVSAV